MCKFTLSFRILPLALLFLVSCSKKDNNGNGPGGSQGDGRLFYSGYTAFKIYDLRSGTEKSIINNAQESHQERYDVSRDGTEIIFYSESLNSTDVTFTTYSATGAQQNSFVIGQYVSGIPKLSPDKSKIAFIWQPAATYPDRYVAVVDRSGKLLKGFKDVNDYAWTTDNKLVMTASSGFYLSNADLSSAQRIAGLSGLPDIPGQLDVSPDNSKVAFVTGGHIHMMNMDGSNHHSVTSSDNKEWYPAWSPDGSRIYFTFDWSGNCKEIRVIPSDAVNLALDPHSDTPAPRVLLGGNRLCSQTMPMVRK